MIIQSGRERKHLDLLTSPHYLPKKGKVVAISGGKVHAVNLVSERVSHHVNYYLNVDIARLLAPRKLLEYDRNDLTMHRPVIGSRVVPGLSDSALYVNDSRIVTYDTGVTGYANDLSKFVPSDDIRVPDKYVRDVDDTTIWLHARRDHILVPHDEIFTVEEED